MYFSTSDIARPRSKFISIYTALCMYHCNNLELKLENRKKRKKKKNGG
jgi:hypothetical protein